MLQSTAEVQKTLRPERQLQESCVTDDPCSLASWWRHQFLTLTPLHRFLAVDNCQIYLSPHQSYLVQHAIASREQTRHHW